PLDELVLRRALIRFEFDVPVPLDAERSSPANRNVTRLELSNPLDNAVRGRRREKREQMADRLPVEGATHFRQLQNRFQLRRERHAALELRVVQRLDAEAIARDEQLPSPRIPDRKCEHA